MLRDLIHVVEVEAADVTWSMPATILPTIRSTRGTSFFSRSRPLMVHQEA